ncbi:MAG TPA: hypothetical protein VNM90_09455 [Haliangium sp.]|nr:hypothetical protein [Haliangium sp.]
MREAHSPGGRLIITVRDPATGAIVLTRRVRNLVTLAGRALLADLLTGVIAGFAKIELVVGGPPDPSNLAFTPRPPDLDDTALENLLVAVPVTTGPTAEQTDEDGDPRMVTPVSGTLEAVAGGDKLVLTEAGIQITKIDDTKILYNRVVFGRITKEANLQMTLTWEVIF